MGSARPTPFAAKPVPLTELRRRCLEARWLVSRIAAHFGVGSSAISSARRRAQPAGSALE